MMAYRFSGSIFTALALSALVWPVSAGVLPDDRADALYHSYNGGGVTIDGPSLLVRKKFLKNFSVSGNYYVDMVSSASIDVVTTASPYSEERTQSTFGLDYLRGKTLMSVGYGKSEEDDYTAKTFSFGISQDIFGDLTTISMGYSRANDEVRSNADPLFVRDVDRRNYRLGLSQIITKNMVLGVSFEAITDEGYLNNPYRSVRYLDASGGNGYLYESELYPNTRTSNALAVRTRYYLPYRAALHGEYRFFSDTWGIQSNMAEIGYTHPWKSNWLFEGKFRHYTQTRADFYSDLFPRAQSQNFLARDKELSTFSSQTLHLGVSYEFTRGWKFVKKGSVNLFFDHIIFDYEDFRDVRVVAPLPGQEPLYNFEADVLQVFVSFWF